MLYRIFLGRLDFVEFYYVDAREEDENYVKDDIDEITENHGETHSVEIILIFSISIEFGLVSGEQGDIRRKLDNSSNFLSIINKQAPKGRFRESNGSVHEMLYNDIMHVEFTSLLGWGYPALRNSNVTHSLSQ